MSGVKGAGGPVPKRSDQRRRRNKPVREIKRPASGTRVKCDVCGGSYVAGAGMATHRRRSHPELAASDQVSKIDGRLPAASDWHSIATIWYDSLALSGQHVFYEPSDWAYAYVIAETMSRELVPQPVFDSDGKEVGQVVRPPRASAVSVWLRAMAALLVTEGDRRRAGVELQNPHQPDPSPQPAPVTSLASWKAGIGG